MLSIVFDIFLSLMALAIFFRLGAVRDHQYKITGNQIKLWNEIMAIKAKSLNTNNIVNQFKRIQNRVA